MSELLATSCVGPTLCVLLFSNYSTLFATCLKQKGNTTLYSSPHNFRISNGTNFELVIKCGDLFHFSLADELFPFFSTSYILFNNI